ncbi:MAG: response regulator transcription factor [Firmicutes bacterium]|uniref:DNA-binding response regulator n=1 Tax=Kroppenstedtia guangzhouensis TaxID=1274356 RepID=A0ABQ1H4N1_9BACL|nr:response regulator transcription factor [Kroppenstedtia guangzhouensis]EGK10283.1 DNA-binding response regulator [Desmospora sp. 8437]MDA8353157.1 response regulator transcription factor [Bacillota bacterium]GGA57433.1 DNA-binding response regulator [Kroppenstedtia guangzhouensis]
MKNILIVDDEKKIREVLSSYLSHAGYRTLEAGTGRKALDIHREVAVDLIILDLMLPDLSGEEVCREIRRQSAVPILMLTAKVEERHRLEGLAIGADDYVIKPFSPREVVARVQAILRRSADDLLAERVSFQHGDLIVDTRTKTVCKAGQPVHLTPIEYRLIQILARNPGRPFSREELVEKLFGFDYSGDERTIDQHVKNLRNKVEPDPKNPTYFKTVFGFGYRFEGGES